MHEQISSKIITYSVFLFTLSIVGISVVSMILPALIISYTYDFPHTLNPFEFSPWTIPIFSSGSADTVICGIILRNMTKIIEKNALFLYIKNFLLIEILLVAYHPLFLI